MKVSSTKEQQEEARNEKQTIYFGVSAHSERVDRQWLRAGHGPAHPRASHPHAGAADTHTDTAYADAEATYANTGAGYPYADAAHANTRPAYVHSGSAQRRNR